MCVYIIWTPEKLQLHRTSTNDQRRLHKIQWSNHIKFLLDALNAASSNDNANAQAANYANNENLAIRMSKQNIDDGKIRIMAIGTKHSSLTSAVAQAIEKSGRFSLRSSHAKMPKAEKKTNRMPKILIIPIITKRQMAAMTRKQNRGNDCAHRNVYMK